jgi:hypothetical protein
MLIVGGFVMCCLAPVANIHFLGSSLTFMMVYVWGRRNESVHMSLLGILYFTAPYFPWVLLGISLIIGNNSHAVDLVGMAAGHFYFFLEDVYPKVTGMRPLKTPQFVHNFFGTSNEDGDEGVVNIRHGLQQQQQQQQQHNQRGQEQAIHSNGSDNNAQQMRAETHTHHQPSEELRYNGSDDAPVTPGEDQVGPSGIQHSLLQQAENSQPPNHADVLKEELSDHGHSERPREHVSPDDADSAMTQDLLDGKGRRTSAEPAAHDAFSPRAAAEGHRRHDE